MQQVYYTEALSGTVTPEMITVAEGRLVIPANKVHLRKNLQPTPCEPLSF